MPKPSQFTQISKVKQEIEANKNPKKKQEELNSYNYVTQVFDKKTGKRENLTIF